jgi:hypothetical protein
MWLALALPPHAFYSGDPGLKLMASLSAIDHPARPFEIDLPTLGTQRVGYLDPMIVRHEDHAHILQSPIFPVVSAPLIAALGLRGAYVLPALSFLALLPWLNVIRRHTGDAASPVALAGLAILANPMLFYALEFWEHAPAVALLAGATALVVSGVRTAPTGAGWTFFAGLCAGLAVLLRPEAAWYAAALGLIGGRQLPAFGTGVAVVLGGFAAVSFAHSGSVLGPHAAANLAPLGEDWVAARWDRVSAWLWPRSALEAAGVLLLAAAWIGAVFRLPLEVRQVVGLAGAAIIAFLASQLWLGRDSFWQAFPAAAVAFVPIRQPGRIRTLWTIVVIAGVGVIATATHTGGAQWGPRFLLIVTPTLLVIVGLVLTETVAPGRLRFPRIALVLVMIVCAIATSRMAYRELRGSKRTYARVVEATATLTPRGGVAVTSVWWFDQVVAALYGTRTFLYAEEPARALEILTELAAAGTLDATVVWSDTANAFSLPPVAGGTCFRVTAIGRIPEAGLTFGRARCESRAQWATDFPSSSHRGGSRSIVRSEP